MFDLIFSISKLFLLYCINILNFTINNCWVCLAVFICCLCLILEENKSYEFIFLCFILGISTLFILNCNHVFWLFLSLELQTMSLLILIGTPKLSLVAKQATFEYFFYTALLSCIFLLGVFFIFNFLTYEDLLIYLSYEPSIEVYIGFLFITFLMVFKLTLFPFHFWAPNIYEGASWTTLLLIGTLPKIGVLHFLFYSWPCHPLFYYILGLFSVLWGTIALLNQTKIKRFLAYSGVVNMGWICIFLSQSFSSHLTLTFFVFIYFISFILIINILIVSYNRNYYTHNKGYKLKFLIEICYLNNKERYSLMILLLSLSGIPPLLGFYVKALILRGLFINTHYSVVILLLLCSLIITFAYLRFCTLWVFNKRIKNYIEIYIQNYLYNELPIINQTNWNLLVNIQSQVCLLILLGFPLTIL
uniref:NADH dehydrogenase subunit 2 n=1 Tax=Chuniphyes multidentata TaxID=316200 RepID=UPI0026E1CA34|nr:NADH dehydrogenase subunit 2 [Chuniphyes multidentata]WJJ69914.1 NADH dehydrogenase subunit 2 [Chuniphyes multidentata]